MRKSFILATCILLCARAVSGDAGNYVSDPACAFSDNDYVLPTHPEGLFANAQAEQANADVASWQNATSHHMASRFFDILREQQCGVSGQFLGMAYGLGNIRQYRSNASGIPILTNMTTVPSGTNESKYKTGPAFHLDYNEYRLTAIDDALAELTFAGSNATFGFNIPITKERESDTHVIIPVGSDRIHVIAIGSSRLSLDDALSATVQDGLVTFMHESNATDALTSAFLHGLVDGKAGGRLGVSTLLDGTTLQVGSSYGAVLESHGWWGDGLTIRVSSTRSAGELLLLDIDTATLPMRDVTGIRIDWNQVPIPSANATHVATGPPGASAAMTMASGHARVLVWLSSLSGNDSVTVHFEHGVPALPPVAPRAATSAASALGTAFALGITAIVAGWLRPRR